MDLGDALVEFVGLALDLIVEGGADGGDGVEVFEFDFFAPFFLAERAKRDVDIAAHLAFFHVGVGDIAVDENLLKGLEVGECFFGGFDICLADDFHQWGAGAIEVDQAGVAFVGGFGNVFFEVDAVESDFFVRCGDGFLGIFRVGEVSEEDFTALAEGEVELSELVVLGHVGVEIVFAVPGADFWGGAAQQHAGEDGFFDGFTVEYWHGPGHTETNWTGVGVWLGAEFRFAGAEHFGAGFDLAVNFEADRYEIVCGHSGRRLSCFLMNSWLSCNALLRGLSGLVFAGGLGCLGLILGCRVGK